MPGGVLFGRGTVVDIGRFRQHPYRAPRGAMVAARTGAVPGGGRRLAFFKSSIFYLVSRSELLFSSWQRFVLNRPKN
jgi:hypothetical protein